MIQSRILVIDDEELIIRSLKQHLEQEGYEVLTAGDGEEGLEKFLTESPDLIILDLNMPGMSGMETLESMKKVKKDVTVIIITAHGDIETAVSAIKLGASDFVEKPFELDRMSIMVKKSMETVQLKKEVTYLREEKYCTYSFSNVIGESPGMKDVLKLSEKIAASDANTILIQGESGTGKSLLARTIHYHSARAQEPFVEVTCTAIPEALIESELFGHEKGAFTDAKNAKKGLFEVANGGTIYLDEIGDIQMSTQAKLLRALEERTFKKVGGLRDIRVNVRVVATTNKKDLEEAVTAGNFRADLYYRLKVFPIYIQPLRERKEDIMPLAMHYITTFNREFKKNVKGISQGARKHLIDYPWFGNARELRNVIERVCILEDTDVIYPEHLPTEIIKHIDIKSDNNNGSINIPCEGISLKNVEKDLIAQALQKSGGNQTKAAKLLEITRDTLRYKMQKYGFL
ncbi:MAG: sigma-54-dependent Fis family transcriptional regulator [Nitrospiraceae bacterium]|nr:MAG: sigma-54-dependent Fis family transcriptional regulator [Nitrospiraceae bacterium]